MSLLAPTILQAARPGSEGELSRLKDALAHRDHAAIAILAGKHLYDSDLAKDISAADLFAALNGCEIRPAGGLDRGDIHVIRYDCSSAKPDRPSGTCLTGNYSLMFFESGSMGTAGLELSRERQKIPSCDILAPIPMPIPGKSHD